MNSDLQYLFDKFERKIKEEDKMNPDKDDPNGKYNFYVPKIRDYLLVYIDNQIADTPYAANVRLYFQNVFNREHLIESTMFYVENCRTRGVSVNNKEKRASSISDFLIAYKHFYEIVLKLKYTMPILITEDLSAEIKVRLENKGYIILESEPFPAMQREEYAFTCKFFNSQYPLHGKQLQVWIILQLSFLYGLSFSTIRNLRTNNIDLETRTIKVLTKSKDKTIILELPYNIFKNIELHITNNNLQNDNLLFFTRTSKGAQEQAAPISSTFLSECFNTLKEQYSLQQQHDEYVANRFTHYGAIKYAIANLLEYNMNIASIVSLTGRDTNFILTCKPENTISSELQSNYLNCIIRSIDTYSKFNY